MLYYWMYYHDVKGFFGVVSGYGHQLRLASIRTACSNSGMRLIRPLLFLWLLFSGPFVLAYQDSLLVERAVTDFLKIQTQGLPGRPGFKVTPLDARNRLAPCATLAVELTPGARLWGRSSVLVRCQEEGGWKIYVPVQVTVQGPYLVTARSLSQGQRVESADLTVVQGELTALPDGILTDLSQALGRVVSQSLPAGRPLRGDMLRQPPVVQQGQTVKVVSNGPGFQVTAGDGRALNNAAEGQVAQVRMPNGHVVSGLARAGGVVEVSY